MTVRARYRGLVVALVLLAVLVALGAVLTSGPAGPAPHVDCERVREGALAQPVNALSALAFVVVGLGVVATARRDRVLVLLGAGAMLVGLGSFAFHRSATDWSGWLDTFAIHFLLLSWIAFAVARRTRAPEEHVAVVLGAAAVVSAAALWFVEGGLADVVLVALIVAAAVLEADLLRRGAGGDRVLLGGAAGLFGIGLVVFAVSRTDGPWCRPDAILQGHAVWHVIAAGVIALLVGYARSARAR